MDQVSLFSDLCGWTFQLPLVLAWESPQVINVSERATPFSLSPCPSSSPQLTLHLLCLLPLPFPQSFSTYHAIGGLGVCGPDVFPKRLEDYFFKSLHRADVPLQLPLPRPAIAETFLCPREHMVWLLCVWSGEPEQNKRIPHWWLFGRQASRCVCVCVFLLPLFLLKLWADVLYWLSGCPFSGPWHQCFILFPCFRPFSVPDSSIFLGLHTSVFTSSRALRS